MQPRDTIRANPAVTHDGKHGNAMLGATHPQETAWLQIKRG
jgi:hypothetical protein